jgi:hypothetical protein
MSTTGVRSRIQDGSSITSDSGADKRITRDIRDGKDKLAASQELIQP